MADGNSDRFMSNNKWDLRKPHCDRYDIVNDIPQIIFNKPIIDLTHKTGIGYAASLTHKQTCISHGTNQHGITADFVW